MGRKERRTRGKEDDNNDDDIPVDGSSSGQSHKEDSNTTVTGENETSKNENVHETTKKKKKKKKNKSVTEDTTMDFAQRREFQRKQAAEKRRSKMKCHICGKTGHIRRECPGVQDDGRGMSRYRGKTSNVKHEKAKYEAEKQERLQRIHNNNNPAGGECSGDTYQLPIEYPEGFSSVGLSEENGNSVDREPFLYYDISCDVIENTISYAKEGRGKGKISKQEAVQEYRQALEAADTNSNFGGMIARSFIKPNRPWIQPISVPLPHKTWYMIGLSRDYLYNDTDMESEVDAVVAILVDTLKRHKETIVGFWALLDYRPAYCKRPGCDRLSQMRRARVTCQAAAEAQVTVQLQVLPGAPTTPANNVLSDTESISLTGTDYAQSLLDLQTLLSDMFLLYPALTVVLSHWCGMAQHMMTFLNAFPKDNLVIGFDGAVGFSKAGILHECAFDVPLDRLELGTGTVIPSEIANALGRDAFYHSGLWPFVAKAVAQYKKTTTTIAVARATTCLALKLYPQLVQAKKVRDFSNDDEESGEGKVEGAEQEGVDDNDDGSTS